jgi:signal transduction histidine kinase
LVVIAVLAVFAADVLVSQNRIGLRRLDGELEATGLQLTHVLREELRERDPPMLAAEESRDAIASASRRVAILDSHDVVLASSFPSADLADLLPAARAEAGARTLSTPRGEWRVHVQRETLGGQRWSIVVGSPMIDLARDKRELREAIWLGIPVALVLSAVGGLWLASVGLRPITTMARRATSLPSAGTDDLGPPVRDDELGLLTQAFNALVARLRLALATQQQFMADASHELRTPVSVIRAASEVALSRDHREESEYREALAMTGGQARHLGILVDDMLLLARADAGAYPLRLTEFFLDDVVDECSRAVGVLAEDRSVTVTSTGASDVPIRADQELLRRLLVNLQQNAVQHTPPGGTVSVDVGVTATDVCIRVADTGTGIAAADLGRVFDRFVQLDPSRRPEGAGLGLTIAHWIARAHGGSLTVESSGPGGTTFRLALPGTAMLARSRAPAVLNDSSSPP